MRLWSRSINTIYMTKQYNAQHLSTRSIHTTSSRPHAPIYCCNLVLLQNIMFIFCKWIWKYGCMHLKLWIFPSQITIDTSSFSFQRIKTLQMLIKFLFPFFRAGVVCIYNTFLVFCQTMGRWVLWNVNKGWDEGLTVTANLSLCPIAHQWLICEGMLALLCRSQHIFANTDNSLILNWD